MNKSLYRNFYYVKESIIEFFQFNKKFFTLAFISVAIGVALGLCVGISNLSNFTFINLSDKTLVAIFSGGSFFEFFISNLLKYAFYIFLILVINNFTYVRWLSYFIFAYLSFILIVDALILISLFSLKGILFCLLGYLVINLLLILLLVIISVMCKLSCDCNGNSSKFCCYPYKNIVLIFLFVCILLLLLSCITKITSNFIVIII